MSLLPLPPPALENFDRSLTVLMQQKSLTKEEIQQVRFCLWSAHGSESFGQTYDKLCKLISSSSSNHYAGRFSVQATPGMLANSGGPGPRDLLAHSKSNLGPGLANVSLDSEFMAKLAHISEALVPQPAAIHDRCQLFIKACCQNQEDPAKLVKFMFHKRSIRALTVAILAQSAGLCSLLRLDEKDWPKIFEDRVFARPQTLRMVCHELLKDDDDKGSRNTLEAVIQLCDALEELAKAVSCCEIQLPTRNESEVVNNVKISNVVADASANTDQVLGTNHHQLSTREEADRVYERVTLHYLKCKMLTSSDNIFHSKDYSIRKPAISIGDLLDLPEPEKYENDKRERHFTKKHNFLFDIKLDLCKIETCDVQVDADSRESLLIVKGLSVYDQPLKLVFHCKLNANLTATTVSESKAAAAAATAAAAAENKHESKSCTSGQAAVDLFGTHSDRMLFMKQRFAKDHLRDATHFVQVIVSTATSKYIKPETTILAATSSPSVAIRQEYNHERAIVFKMPSFARNKLEKTPMAPAAATRVNSSRARGLAVTLPLSCVFSNCPTVVYSGCSVRGLLK